MAQILFENEEALVAFKPAGQPAIPGRGDAAEGALNLELEAQCAKKMFVVHRLDLEASGLMLFAKNAAAHARYCEEFKRRRVEKTYLALVEGDVKGPGEVDRPIKEFGSGRMGVGEGGKPSLTRYTVRAKGRNCSLLTAEPATGRRHQLRVHFYAMGHPILGDPLYGKTRPVGGAPRLMLHALGLKMAGLPAFHCPPPPDFQAVLKQFELF